MIALTVSAEAKADLAAIYDYGVEMFGGDRAEAYLRAFDTTLDRIREHPLTGQVHDTVRPPIRSLPSGRHRIYYDIMSDRVVVQRVLHQAMDVARYL